MFLGEGISVSSFIIVGCVWQILGRVGLFAPPPPHPWAALKKPILNRVKGARLDLRIFLLTQSPLNMTKNSFYFVLKAPFVLKIFKFLSWIFGQVEKWLDQKYKINFEIFDVTTWATNSCNANIAQYLTK